MKKRGKNVARIVLLLTGGRRPRNADIAESIMNTVLADGIEDDEKQRQIVWKALEAAKQGYDTDVAIFFEVAMLLEPKDPDWVLNTAADYVANQQGNCLSVPDFVAGCLLGAMEFIAWISHKDQVADRVVCNAKKLAEALAHFVGQSLLHSPDSKGNPRFSIAVQGKMQNVIGKLGLLRSADFFVALRQSERFDALMKSTECDESAECEFVDMLISHIHRKKLTREERANSIVMTSNVAADRRNIRPEDWALPPELRPEGLES